MARRWWRRRQGVRAAADEPEPAPAAPSLTELMLRIRRTERQMATLRAFERRLSGQLHHALADGHSARAHELVARRIAVTARLEETVMLRGALRGELETRGGALRVRRDVVSI